MSLPEHLPFYLGLGEEEDPGSYGPWWHDWMATTFLLTPTSPELGDLLRKHRFVCPNDMSTHHCANGWSGESWPQHIKEVIEAFRASQTDDLP